MRTQIDGEEMILTILRSEYTNIVTNDDGSITVTAPITAVQQWGRAMLSLGNTHRNQRVEAARAQKK